jgi:fibronectin type 3 domain-containing protein
VYNGVLSCYYPEGKTLVSIDAPMNVGAQSRVSGALVTWNKCAGAKGYYVYRKSGNGSFKLIGTVSSADTLSYLDTTAKAGETYSYTVRAFNGSSLSTYNLSGKSLTFIYTPRLSSARSTQSGVVINYTRSAGCDGYYIYRRTADSGWLRIAVVSGADNLSYVDKTAQKGTEYIYTVKAYKGSLMSSYFTNGIKVKDIY